MDARRVRNASGRQLIIAVFTADNIERHLADGWTPEQLTTGKVSILGAKTHRVPCNSTDTVKDLKRALEDRHGFNSSCFTLLRGKTAMRDTEPLFESTTLILLPDAPPKPVPAPSAPVQPGSLKLKDPRENGGSLTMTTTPEEEEADEKARQPPPPPAPARPPPAGSERPVDRRLLAAAAERKLRSSRQAHSLRGFR
ncbi:hypothetical protein DIPPA_34821 [Diplonema papillatum]|nr:hypothetical protein DIPPA_34821 [Diplonema papillatum]